MARMVRKQIYLEPHQEQRLKTLSRLLQVSEAELIRRALDLYLRQALEECQRLEAWQRLKTFAEWWMSQGPVPGGRTWTREELYEERLRWPRK